MPRVVRGRARTAVSPLPSSLAAIRRVVVQVDASAWVGTSGHELAIAATTGGFGMPEHNAGTRVGVDKGDERGILISILDEATGRAVIGLFAAPRLARDLPAPGGIDPGLRVERDGGGPRLAWFAPARNVVSELRRRLDPCSPRLCPELAIGAGRERRARPGSCGGSPGNRRYGEPDASVTHRWSGRAPDERFRSGTGSVGASIGFAGPCVVGDSRGCAAVFSVAAQCRRDAARQRLETFTIRRRVGLQACFRAVTLTGRQLVFVLGKGGVGRTTIAAALGIAAAEAGRETLVAEIASQARLLSLFGHGQDAPQGTETPLRDRLHGLSIDPARALEEYLVMHLPLKALARKVAGDRAFSQLASAAPGLRELVTMGKLWYLAQRRADRAAPYEVVIVDMPATGHGLAMLRAPSTFADIANTGPLHRQTSTVAHDLTDRRKTAAVVVALAEELATNEAIGLVDGLRQLRVDPAIAVVNAVAHRLVEDADLRALNRARNRASDVLAHAGVLAGLARGAADVRRERELARLHDATGVAVTVLPEVDEPTHEGLDELAHDLAHAWHDSAAEDSAA